MTIRKTLVLLEHDADYMQNGPMEFLGAINRSLGERGMIAREVVSPEVEDKTTPQADAVRRCSGCEATIILVNGDRLAHEVVDGQVLPICAKCASQIDYDAVFNHFFAREIVKDPWQLIQDAIIRGLRNCLPEYNELERMDTICDSFPGFFRQPLMPAPSVSSLSKVKPTSDE